MVERERRREREESLPTQLIRKTQISKEMVTHVERERESVS